LGKNKRAVAALREGLRLPRNDYLAISEGIVLVGSQKCIIFVSQELNVRASVIVVFISWMRNCNYFAIAIEMDNEQLLIILW
jgi:hypothetical protein